MQDGPFKSDVTMTLEVIKQAMYSGYISEDKVNQALRSLSRVPEYYHMTILCAILNTPDPRDAKSE